MAPVVRASADLEAALQRFDAEVQRLTVAFGWLGAGVLVSIAWRLRMALTNTPQSVAEMDREDVSQ